MNLQTITRSLPILSRVLTDDEEEKRKRLARYRGDQTSDSDPRVMARPLGDGKYGERVIGPDGQIVGLGDQRDYAPLANSPLPILTRPPVVAPPIEAPGPYVAPTPSLADVNAEAPPIMIRRNNKNRPLEAIGGGDPLERDQALLEAQQGYKAPRSTKDLLVRLGMGFLGGGIPGAIGQGLGYELNQGVRNQDAVGRDMADTQGRIQRQVLQRNQTNDWLNDQSTRGYRDAQSQQILTRAMQPPKTDSKFIERPDGVYEVSAANPDGRKVGNIPPEARNKNANPTRYFERPDGVYGINEDHPEGFKVSGVPGTPEKPDTAEFENSQLQQNIQEATAERDRIWASLKDIPPTIETIVTDPYTLEQTKKQVPNPAYNDLMTRGRELDDHIRTYRGQLKAPKVLTRRSGNYTEADVRARAKAAGKDADAAVAKAKAAGLLK